LLRVIERRTTLSYMKTASVTIRLDAKLQRDLDRLSRQLGRSRSDLVRDAVRRQLALLRFEQARRTLLPLAEAHGVLTDEDVFASVS
jgi:predicted transcriptional regulator